MNSPGNSTLRELGRSYYEGLLSFDEYRVKRRRLIDKLTAVMPPLAETDRPTQSIDDTPKQGWWTDVGRWLRNGLPWLMVVGLVALLFGWTILFR